MPNPTIVAASLDDKELRDSIDKLVAHVGAKTQEIKSGFDKTVQEMIQSLQSLGNVKIDLSNTFTGLEKAKEVLGKGIKGAAGSGGGSAIGGASISELRKDKSEIESQLKSLEESYKRFYTIRDEISSKARFLKGSKQDLRALQGGSNVYEYDDFGNNVPLTIEKAKQRVKEYDAELKKLLQERHKFPAPSKEELQRYDELKQKYEEVKKTLNNALAPETVGDLKKQIKEEDKFRDSLALGSQELREQNQLIAEQTQRKKMELMTEEEKLKFQQKQTEELERQKTKELKKSQSPYLKEFNAANTMSTKELQASEAKLVRLQNIQRAMRQSGLFDEAQLNRVQKAIDNVTNKITKLRNAKPKSLQEVLGMDESSVDAIARKMRALKSVQINPKNAQDVKALSDAYQTLAKKQNEYLGKNRLIQKSNKQLTSILNYVRNRIIYAFTVGSMMSFARDIIRVRAEYEMLDRSLGILVGDFEKGTAIFNELNQMALKSPFTLIELGTAAKQLTAYNFAANEVVDTTRRLADISAALGVPMERLTYNLGQIKAQGVLNARDARDFANAGLAIVPMLAKMYTEQKTFGDQMVTTAQVYDMMSKKMVTYQDVLKVLYQVTDEGGKFFDFQARQSETLKVQLANLTLAYNNMVNEMGKDSQGSIAKGVQLAKKLFENWKEVRRVLLTVITTLGTYKAVSAIVFALNSRMFVGSILVNLRNYINGIKAATGAMATFNAVTRANPIGFLASTLAAVAGYFLWFKNDVEDAAEGVETFGESATKTVNKVKTLQKIIDGTSETSSTYKKALSELSTIAHEQGIELDAEKARREDVNKATERTIELIKEEAAERQRANQLTKAQETYEKETGEIKSKVKGGIEKTSEVSAVNESVRKELKDSSEAISEIIGSIIEDNLNLIVNKTGEEAEKGIDRIEAQILKRLKKTGVSSQSVDFLKLGQFFKTAIQDYKEVAEKQEASNRIIDNFYNSYKKGSKAIMEFTEKVNANAKALQNNSNDALSLYNNIYDIVEIAKKNHVINFDLKLTAEKPPKWMMDIKLPELQRLAARFTAIAQSGGHAQGYDREGTYERGLRYAAAARLKQEEEERKARQKEKSAKTKTKKEDPVLVALREEIKLVKDLQSAYDTLTKKGYSHADTMAKIQGLYGKTLNLLNNELSKHGLPLLDVSIVKGNNPNEVLAFFERLRDVLESKGMSNLKRMEVVEGVIKEFRVKADTYNLDVITKGLNNELGKLKDEYELAVELDADPEMGNMFASYFGINTNELPRTFQDAAKKAQTQIDRVFEENGRKDKIDILSMLNKESFDKWVKDSGLKMDSELVKAVEQFRQYLHKVQGDEIKNTTKNYQALIEKYGGLQAKILKIYKDSVKEQGDIVRQFGDNTQIKQALDLIRQINISQDPAEIARLQEQLATVMRDVVNGNPIAMKTYEASQNEQKSKESKAYWEDFKNSDMYSMVFADMANNSIFSIELIIQKLNELKDKVKEDPTSMKELIRSLENAKEEFAARNPIQGIIDGVDRWTKASQRLKDAKKDLTFAIGTENNAKQQVKDAEQAKDTNKLAVATAVLASATANREKQEKRVAKASNDVQQAQEDTKKSIKGVADTMKGAQDTLSGVSAIFKAFGDDETAEAIDAINQGFSAMISVVMGVYTAMQMLNTAVPWLLAISAALAVIVGLVSFLSGHSDKKITEQVEESERAVKRLENRVESLKGTYDAMTDSAEHSYGAQSAAATLAASSIKEQEIALKRLMLSETKRQLRLEQSRDSKKRDDDKILSLQKDIISQQNEIDSMLRETNRAVDEVVDSLLGISRGSWAEELTDAMITAFKAGEDYMDVFEDSWEEMVQNMVVKTIAAKVIGDALEKNVLSRIKQIEKEETDPYREAEANIAKYKTELQNKRLENENEWFAQVSQLPEFTQALETLGEDAKKAFSESDNAFWVAGGGRRRFLEQYGDQLEQALFKVYDNYVTDIEGGLNVAQQTAQERALREVLTGETGKATKQSLMDSISSVFPDFMETWGVKFGQDADKELSALQRGIQGITEQQAGALESYWNANTQQQYVQSNLLTQIRDAVVAMNGDIQLSVQGQILLQLQQSYQVQMSIESILQGVLVPSGRAFAVELMS